MAAPMSWPRRARTPCSGSYTAPKTVAGAIQLRRRSSASPAAALLGRCKPAAAVATRRGSGSPHGLGERLHLTHGAEPLAAQGLRFIFATPPQAIWLELQ